MKKMKKYISVSIVGFMILNLNGCYTQLLVKDDCDQDNATIIVYYPAPQPPPPVPDPTPPIILPYDPPAPEQPVEKYRQPELQRSPSNEGVKDRLRNSGGRNEKDKGNRR